MIPVVLKITLVVAIAFYFILILNFLKNKALELKYTLLWIMAGVVMGIIVLFPQILSAVIGWFGIETYMNGIYVICLGFVIAILMTLTSIVSRQLSKITTLIQENAILEKRICDLEQQFIESKEII